MSLRVVLRSACGLALVAAAACGGSPAASSATPAADAAAPATNGCAPAMFVAGSSTNTVSFGGQSGSPLFGYDPPCLRIKAGASVTFAGDFSVHPLSPGTGPTTTTAGSPGNPIPATETGTSMSVTFPAAGTYPYFCEMHYAAGMAGVVLVEP